MFEAQTEWISPESFPDLKDRKYIAYCGGNLPNFVSSTFTDPAFCG